MRQALENAARVHGETPTVLHATDAGRPIYERMGYESISTHTLFMEKRFLAGALSHLTCDASVVRCSGDERSTHEQG